MNIVTTYRGIDYGARKGTLGVAIHMTEGNGGIGDVRYLAQRGGETLSEWRTRVRGVSANFVIINDGTIYQMVGWGRATGSMNPINESDEIGFYRQSIIEAVMGNLERDPNAYSISVEIAGKRDVGPTKAQVASLVELVAEARRRYPTLRGAFGHADQTTTKGCPGKSPLMMEAWDRIGHGLFLPDTATTEEPALRSFLVTEKPQLAVIRAGAWLYDAYHEEGEPFRPSDGNIQLSPNRPLFYVGHYGKARIVAYEGVTVDSNLTSKTYYLPAADVTSFLPYPVPAPDCTAPIAAAIKADRAKARIVYTA
jgi:hypothetical protein